MIFIGIDYSGKTYLVCNLVNYLNKEHNDKVCLITKPETTFPDDNKSKYEQFLALGNGEQVCIDGFYEEIPLVYLHKRIERFSFSEIRIGYSPLENERQLPEKFLEILRSKEKVKLCFVYDETQRNYEFANQDEVLTSIYDYIMKDETIDKTNISCKLILTKQDMYPTQFEEFRDLSKNFLNKNIPNFTASFLPHNSANDFMFYHVYSNITQGVEPNDDVTDEKSPALTSIKKLETEDYTLAQQLFDWILN